MELIEYLSRLWQRKWIVLGVVVICVAVTLAALLIMPRKYQATAILQAGGINSYLENPGQVSSAPRQTLPSNIQPITQTYLDLLESPSVAEAARQKMQEQGSVANGVSNDGTSSSSSSSVSSSDKFDYSGSAQATRGGESDLVYIEVQADTPEVARNAANTLSQVLIEQARKQQGQTIDDFVNDMQKNQVDPINKQLEDILIKTETLKPQVGGDVTARNIEIANLANKAKSLDETRKQYTDIIGRIRLNQALQENNLNIFSPAALPVSRQAPSLARNGGVAAIVGLLLGVTLVMAVDRRKRPQAADASAL